MQNGLVDDLFSVWKQLAFHFHMRIYRETTATKETPQAKPQKRNNRTLTRRTVNNADEKGSAIILASSKLAGV